MKLFIIAALIAVAAAGRLEHLERAYLPPFGSSQGSLGANSGAFGGGSQFAGATSNQYLPPDHGPSNGAPQFAGSLTGFQGQNQGQNYHNHHAASAQQYAIPSTQYGSPQASSFGSASFQGSQPSQYPQQPFDEETGYHY